MAFTLGKATRQKWFRSAAGAQQLKNRSYLLLLRSIPRRLDPKAPPKVV
jgi:hypothetical protein